MARSKRNQGPNSFADGLSHPEMLSVTGMTTDRLMTWYKRGTMPAGFVQAPGRGNRRRYPALDTLTLMMTRVLADAGLPLEDASCLAPRFTIQGVTLITSAGGDLDPLRIPADFGKLLEAWPEPWVAVLRRPKGWAPSATDFVSANFVAVSIPRDDTVPKIEKWMREIGINHIGIIDVCTVCVEFVVGLQQVLEARKAARL